MVYDESTTGRRLVLKGAFRFMLAGKSQEKPFVTTDKGTVVVLFQVKPARSYILY